MYENLEKITKISILGIFILT